MHRGHSVGRLTSDELIPVVERHVAEAGAGSAFGIQQWKGVAELVGDAVEGPLLGKGVVPGSATVGPGEGADVLHHAGFLVVRLLDQEAVVGDVLGGEWERTQRGPGEEEGERREAKIGERPAAHASHSRNVPTRSQALRPMMTSATPQAIVLSTGPLTKAPILARSPVNCTSGTTAKESCRLRITWLRIRRAPAPCSPYIAVTITAGTMAMSRVMRRRSQAGSRMSRNPSITIWPASVPVMVEFWPEARSATANSVLARVVPSSGVSSR